MATNSIIRNLAAAPETEATMLALFIGHGNPMNAIETPNSAGPGPRSPYPCQSQGPALRLAHGNGGNRVTAMEQPKTIHDFYGFPPALFEKRYPAPGSPDLARMVQGLVRTAAIELDSDWDWTTANGRAMPNVPDADVPVIQLSLDQRKIPASHYELGRELRGLRKKGVLILGSGNIAHNLREMAWKIRRTIGA